MDSGLTVRFSRARPDATWPPPATNQSSKDRVKTQRHPQAGTRVGCNDMFAGRAAPSAEASLAPPPAPVRQQQASDQRRQTRLQRYAEMRQLHQDGLTQTQIATRFGLNPKTVQRWFRAGTAPERQPRQRQQPVRLAPYTAHLVARWNAGCHNAVQLCREITAQGYTGKLTMVRVFCAQLRQAQGWPGMCAPAAGNTPVVAPPRQPRLGDVVWWMMRPWERLTSDEQHLVARLPTVHAEVAQAFQLVQQFTRLIRERKATELAAWLASVPAAGPPE